MQRRDHASSRSARAPNLTCRIGIQTFTSLIPGTKRVHPLFISVDITWCPVLRSEPATNPRHERYDVAHRK
jgi:hypothetical protein